MQNLVLQTAKVAPVKAGAQPNQANALDDNATDAMPGAFAELLKQQVQQKKTDSTDASENEKMQETAVADIAVSLMPVCIERAQVEQGATTSKSEPKHATENDTPPIQDVLLMQIGLQSSGQINGTSVSNTAMERGMNAIFTSGNPSGSPSVGVATNEKPMLTPDSGLTQAPDMQINTASDGSPRMDDTETLRQPMQAPYSAELKADKVLRETEMKPTMLQLSALMTAPTRLPEQVLTAAAAASEIATPFGKPEWNQSVNQKIVWMVGAGEQSATLTLNPPDLGPLQVVIQVDNDQVDTTFISENPEVRQALQDGMNMLRDKLQDSGIQLGNAQVSTQAQSQRHFEQAMQQRASQHPEQAAPAQDNHTESTLSQPVVQRISNGLVDTFA